MASESTIFIIVEDVNDEIPLFTEREQERVLEGEPIGTIVTRSLYNEVYPRGSITRFVESFPRALLTTCFLSTG